MATTLDQPGARRRARHDTSINLRLPVQTRDLIDSAAAALGKSRSEFMIGSAREQAIDVLLDQRLFMLDEAAATAFLRALDHPVPPPEKLAALLASRSPWE